MADKSALVIGATGGIGGAVARVLRDRGWEVRGLNRDAASAARRRPDLDIAWLSGDAMNAADVTRAARGVSLIVHGANPPGYRNWAGTVRHMLDSSIAAAKASGARILFPGTVYNYGADAFPVLRESAPQHPFTRKGQLRVAMERRLQAAAEEGVRSVVVRFGDFFGPGAGNSWFAQGLVAPGRKLTHVTYPGRPEIGHAWAYLPDAAETMVRVTERGDALAPFDSFHMEGHWFEQGGALVESIRRVAGRAVPARRLPWWAIRLASPFVPLFREMAEMRYLWKIPLRLDNAKLFALIGPEPHTAVDSAVHATLEDLRCL